MHCSADGEPSVELAMPAAITLPSGPSVICTLTSPDRLGSSIRARWKHAMIEPSLVFTAARIAAGSTLPFGAFVGLGALLGFGTFGLGVFVAVALLGLAPLGVALLGLALLGVALQGLC